MKVTKKSRLVAVVLGTVCATAQFAIACEDDSTNEKAETNIETIVIVSDITDIEAGNSFNFSLLINDDDSFDYSKLNYDIVVVNGFDYCTTVDHNILVGSDTPNNQQISFYVKYSDVKSDSYTFTVTNRKAVLEAQIEEKEETLKDLQSEYDTINRRVEQAQTAVEVAEGNYNDYKYQCIRNGYLTSSGDYKYNTPDSVRTQLEILFATWNEADYQYRQWLDMLIDKDNEIRKLKSDISELKKELASL